jgi:hypothetical protein
MENFSHEEIIEILSKRGGRKILNKGFSYNFKRSTSTKIIWRCRQEDCKSYLHTDQELALVKEARQIHEPNFEKTLLEYGYMNML